MLPLGERLLIEHFPVVLEHLTVLVHSEYAPLFPRSSPLFVDVS